MAWTLPRLGSDPNQSLKQLVGPTTSKETVLQLACQKVADCLQFCFPCCLLQWQHTLFLGTVPSRIPHPLLKATLPPVAKACDHPCPQLSFRPTNSAKSLDTLAWEGREERAGRGNALRGASAPQYLHPNWPTPQTKSTQRRHQQPAVRRLGPLRVKGPANEHFLGGSPDAFA